jgi:putative membrane-bound dehydrogenase-like protein
VAVLLGSAGHRAAGEIPKPTDAPQPLSPAESAKQCKLPDGLQLELVACEPLIHEPSGVCWDAKGRMFVCELHGYNIEGQLDIEQLNKTGELDRVVRRLDADQKAKEAAKSRTFGTVKLLVDTDGDGLMDQQETWADRLPPCYGICPARDGIVVACAPDIVFLADRDGDGRAEVRETLFTGFAVGAIERGINCPQWGLDDWIYFGRGHGGGKITGPHLAKAVELPNTDFRMRADGSAIEPISGGTHTIGFAFTERGDRLIVSTGTPGIQVAPIPWHYLERNRDLATPPLEQNAAADGRAYPASRPHPWRTRRAEDPGFSKFYTDHYGLMESAPNGYFTSACSPLVYQGDLLSSLRGQLLACEPAQNFIYRGTVTRDGPRLRLARPAGEERSEFLTSTDAWFHPIALASAPDDSIGIVDFYREIIEDYSAIPRYLQQQYELDHGQDRGRIWRLTRKDAPAAGPADMSHLSAEQLVAELASRNFWRRLTARRLLTERKEISTAGSIRRLLAREGEPWARLNALYALAALGKLDSHDVLAAMASADAGVRINGLRLAEPWLDRDAAVFDSALALADDGDVTVLLQLALTLGESRDERVVPALARLARERGNVLWMDAAVLSSVSGRGSQLLGELLRSADGVGNARALLAPLCATIAAGRDPGELSSALLAVAAVADKPLAVACMQGLRSSFSRPTQLPLSEPAVQAIKGLAAQSDRAVAEAAAALVQILKLESAAERETRVVQALRAVTDIQLPVERRLAAVAELAVEDDANVTREMLAAVATSTPQVRDAILSAVFSRRERLADVVAAIERQTLPPSTLTAVQRAALLESPDAALRKRAAALFDAAGGNDPQMFARYAAALKSERDSTRGARLFSQNCGVCHQAHGVGVAVGPDLSAEFQRAEETILRDILAPSSAITSGYATYVVTTDDGRVFTGLLASESASSVIVKQAGGKAESVLRKDIDEIKASTASLMPDNLTNTLSPRDVADILAWLRFPPTKVVLIDEDLAFADLLNQGTGTAGFIDSDRQRGRMALRITPPQRFSASIPGWEYRIRENPAPGEFRYLRFAWKSIGASGIMIELANGGAWPAERSSQCRYVAGKNTTAWQAVALSPDAPTEWTIVTRDVWKDFGDLTITGIAPTACEGPALFDRVELLRTPD